MTVTGDTVILHQELAYADVLPVSFRRLPEPLDPVNAATITERNLRLLLASAALDEHGHHEKSSDDSPHAADLLRIDLKVNLLLDLVGALLAATQSRPSPVPARFNPHGIVWEASGEVPPAGAYGLVEIHLRDCLVQPLALAGTVADEPAEHHVHVRFDPLPEPVADQLERLVFRRHRRQVAGGRTQRRV
ncbi:MAG: PilZ domain-containing protein [Steroidobacteraceae bacterium]|nr:PilZ domain-containing protein [Nevskiaceae bacterium]MCP5339079.1 PilZ domain-containing protein [Nevskiaceae bacterium]MCP5359988.1 PilZ domain-containing protein [Nevskiaceae bacterium]MCP5472192.1 PilZ domain-containing protein [Nevskiaceae bacterium]